ncbi:hypothetical protein ILYODFUR_013340 [Ilyodon furcidens]|uniref:Uncharacterized protein n=1 Tax=Ilyodon furcidens TaxID=33524 RepID=A0ABV0TX40_9TELE
MQRQELSLLRSAVIVGLPPASTPQWEEEGCEDDCSRSSELCCPVSQIEHFETLGFDEHFHSYHVVKGNEFDASLLRVHQLQFFQLFDLQTMYVFERNDLFRDVFPLIRHWWRIGGQGAKKPGVDVEEDGGGGMSSADKRG